MSSNVEVMNNLIKDQDIKTDIETIKGKSLWGHAWETLKKDKVAVLCMSIVALYSLVALLSFSGLIASDWSKEIGPSYASPSLSWLFGLDIFGRSVALKVIKGAESAMVIGFAASVCATFLGVTLGALAGYFGGFVDEAITWFFTTIQSIPWIMLVMGIAMVSPLGKGLSSVVLALALTSWVSICRIIRGEVLRHKEREYVQAASSLGAGHIRKLVLHIIPNVSHLIIINFSLQFQTAIKAEVILSYLGLGVQGQPSWGLMIDDAKLELARDPMIWWGLASATAAMFFVVLAFNLLGDALRDALDPKLKGK